MSCDQSQGRLDFPTCREGGGLLPFNIAIAEEVGVALTSATIEFKLADTDTVALTLTSGSGLTLTATTAGAWIVTVDQINGVTLAPGVYSYNLKTIDASGLPQFYVGGTWTILNV